MCPPFNKKRTSVFILRRKLCNQLGFPYNWSELCADADVLGVPAENTDRSQMNRIALDALRFPPPKQSEPSVSRSKGWPSLISSVVFTCLWYVISNFQR